jgi:hypothetical protein
MVIKLDLSKAYDKANQLKLRFMLLHGGFCLLVVNQIMGCISSISFALLINGSASKKKYYFKGG